MGKLIDLINKDTQEKNETKRMTVIIRQLSLSFVVLAIVNLILNIVIMHSLTGALLWGGMIIIDVLNLMISYHCSKNTVLAFFITQKGLWILLSIMLYGWEGGFQFFLILLFILYSFGETGYNWRKLVFDFICFAMFTVFVLFVKGKPGLVDISGADKAIWIINLLAFCVAVGFVVTSFSHQSQATEEKIVKYNEQLKLEAGQDPLTGLKNRRSTSEFIRSLIKTDSTFSICMCDIDYFKRVNDTYGHEFGDDVLNAVADVFRSTAGDKAYISRWGGEEFLLIFPGMNGDDAYIIVDAIRAAVKNRSVKNGDEEVKVTLTYGLTEFDLNKNVIENIKEVDEKLYMGKAAGRDRIVY